MMQREKGGVVDAHLNVYGVQGLKVAGAIHLTVFALWVFDEHLSLRHVYSPFKRGIGEHSTVTNDFIPAHYFLRTRIPQR